MGFAKGSPIAEAVIEAAMEYIPEEEDRSSFYLQFIESLFEQDWDTYDEVRAIDDVFDAVLDDYLRERGLLDEDDEYEDYESEELDF